MAHHTPPASQTLGLTLTEHRAIVFDVYGTLVDWESAIHDALVGAFPDLERKEILARYAAVEANLQSQFPNTPYSQILELAYRQLTAPPAESDEVSTENIVESSLRIEQPTTTTTSTSEEALSLNIDDNAKRFGRSIPRWKPFPDTIIALHRLKKHYALVVLSNVDDASFSGTHAALCSHAYPGSAYPTITPDSPFSLILTAQLVGAYKPDPRMLASVLKQLSSDPDTSLPAHPLVRADPTAVLVVANSTRHDIVPAMQHGLHSVWISRQRSNVIGNEGSVAAQGQDAAEGLAVQGKYPFTWRYETLSRLADAVEEEARSRRKALSEDGT